MTFKLRLAFAFVAFLPPAAVLAGPIGEPARSIFAREKSYDVRRFAPETEASELDAILLAESEPHGSVLRSVAFSPDGNWLFSVAVNGVVKISNAATGAESRGFTDKEFAQYGLVVRADGKQFVTAGDKGARIWEVGKQAPVATLTGHAMLVLAVAFSPDGARIVTGSADKTARVWDANNGKLLLTLAGHDHFVNAVAFSPDGKRIATASSDKTARIWDAATGMQLTTLAGHEGWVESVAFSPDGSQVLTGSLDHTARVWEAATGKTLFTLAGHPLYVIAVYSPDGSRIATGSGYDIVRIWDARNGKRLAVFYGGRPMGAVFSLAFSPNGQLLASATWDGFAQMWAVTTKNQALPLGKK